MPDIAIDLIVVSGNLILRIDYAGKDNMMFLHIKYNQETKAVKDWEFVRDKDGNIVMGETHPRCE